MKADFNHHRCCVSPRVVQCAACHLLPVLAVACLITFVTTGCQFGHGHPEAVEPHYGQLEQACFGYEPTVWREMPGDCQQAVRMIPNEVIELPAADDKTPTPAEPPTAQPSPGPLPLDQVPDQPGQDSGLPRFMDLPSGQPAPATTNPAATDQPATDGAAKEPPPGGAAEQPPATNPSAVEPPATPEPKAPEPKAPEPKAPQPTAPGPAQPTVPPPPATEEPAMDTPAPADQPPAETPPTPKPEPPAVSHRSPNLAPPVAQRPSGTRSVAARELFRSMEQALNQSVETRNAAPPRLLEKKPAVGLARFISY